MANILCIGADCILHACGDVSIRFYDLPFTTVSVLSTTAMTLTLINLMRSV